MPKAKATRFAIPKLIPGRPSKILFGYTPGDRRRFGADMKRLILTSAALNPA